MSTAARIRPLTVADAADMAEVLSDPALYHYTGGTPPTVEELTRRYTLQVVGHSPDGADQWFNWVVIVAGRPVGYVQATRPTGESSADLAWVIGQPWQGHGHATQAAREMAQELRSEEIEVLTAHIAPGHEASEKVARSLGLRPTPDTIDGERRWSGRAGSAQTM